MGVKFGDLITRTTPQTAIDHWGDAAMDDRAQKLDPAGMAAIPPPSSSIPPPPPPPAGNGRCCNCRCTCKP